MAPGPPTLNFLKIRCAEGAPSCRWAQGLGPCTSQEMAGHALGPSHFSFSDVLASLKGCCLGRDSPPTRWQSPQNHVPHPLPLTCEPAIPPPYSRHQPTPTAPGAVPQRAGPHPAWHSCPLPPTTPAALFSTRQPLSGPVRGLLCPTTMTMACGGGGGLSPSHPPGQPRGRRGESAPSLGGWHTGHTNPSHGGIPCQVARDAFRLTPWRSAAAALEPAALAATCRARPRAERSGVAAASLRAHISARSVERGPHTSGGSGPARTRPHGQARSGPHARSLCPARGLLSASAAPTARLDGRSLGAGGLPEPTRDSCPGLPGTPSAMFP